MFHLVGSILCALVIFNQIPTSTDSLFPVEIWNYESKGRRDPFVPLMGIELGKGKLSHLSVENLTLIGILWGDRGYFGLVKDGVNNGYILKKGSKVAGGQVTQITNKAVIFEIMHAGVVTKYELRLEQKEGR